MGMPQLVVTAVLVEGRSKSGVACDYGVSRRWVVTLVQRYLAEGEAGLAPRSRRPLHSPGRTAKDIEDEIVALRKDLERDGHEAGAATIAAHLQQRRGESPAVSTIWRILSARGFVTPQPHKRPKSTADQDTSSKTTAVVWLGAFLDPGPRWSNDVHHVRKLKGISEKAFKTAKRKLNVESVKTGDDWFMRLPNHADRIPEGPPEFQEVPQEVPDVPYNSEGTSSDLPRSDGTSSDSSQNEGTSCQEVPQEVPPQTKKSPSSCEDNKKSLLTDIEPKGTSWNFLFGEVRK